MNNEQLKSGERTPLSKSILRYIPGRSSFLSFLFASLLIPASFYSCSDEEGTVVGFETDVVRKTESDSVYSVKILLGKVTTSTTVTIDIYGTAALDGDYSMVTQQDTSTNIVPVTGSSSASSQQVFVVPAGGSYAELFFRIKDDPYVEPRAENILFRISAISNESIEASLQNFEYQFIITDNDTPPSDALRVDLSWRLGDGISVTNGDFDMYLVKNVVVSNGQVTNKDFVDQVTSKNTTGFESFNLDSSVPDDKYYIMIRYVSGTYDADTELILSKSSSYSRVTAHIASTSVGKDFYFGPITKSGTTFSRVAEEEVAPDWIID